MDQSDLQSKDQPGPDIRFPVLDADEYTTMRAVLDYLRESMIGKTTGVAAAALHDPGVASGTSLAWLLRHLAAVERNWFVWSYGGEGEKEDPNAAPDPARRVEDLVDEYRAAITAANAVLDATADLSAPGVRCLRPDSPPPTLRWVLVHMIEETARHAGHADILRERIDSSVGR